MYDPNSSEGQKSTNEGSMSNFNKDLFDPEKVFSLLQRNVWLILLCIIISVSAAYYLVNYYFMPVYQSSGTILISLNEDSLPGSGGTGSGSGGVENIVSQSFTVNSGNSIQSAIYLFQSRELSEDVANQLQNLKDSNKSYPIFWKNFPEDSTEISTELVASRIRSGLIVKPIEPQSNLANAPPNLLSVSYQSYSPREAAKVVNLILDAFLEKSLAQKQNTASKALSFLEDKKEEVRSQLNEAEDRLVKFRNENELVAIDAQAGNSVNTLSQLKAEKQNLQIQLESLNSSIENFEKQIEAIKPGMADQYSDAIGPTITQYQQRLAELRGQRFVILSNNPQLKSNPNSEPELRRLNQQISDLESEIQSLTRKAMESSGGIVGGGTGDGNLAQELSNIQQNLIQLRIEKNQIEAQIPVLNERIKEAESFLDTYPDNQVKLARLQTEVQRHQELLNTIISQESEISLWQQTQNSSGSIVDPANINSNPVKPRKIIWLGLAGMLGMVIPVAFVFVKVSMSPVIKSSEQMESYPYPLLAVIFDHSMMGNSISFFSKGTNANSKVSRDVIFYHQSDSPVAESYRKIVNQILYNKSESKIKSLLITSSGQGEGKTTLAANLAAAFSELEKKVLIIDCDFRRPAVHKLFSLDNSNGISEVLTKGMKLSEAIKATDIQDLFVLPTGSKPASPAKLLTSGKFNEMIKVLKPNYDLIIYDTPPQGIVSDVMPLLELSDLVIVTAKFGATNENVLKLTLQDLEKNEESNINLVLTGYKPSSSYDSYNTKGMYKYRYQEYYEYEKLDKK